MNGTQPAKRNPFLRTALAPLGGVQLKAAEVLTRRLLADHAPCYHLVPAPPREQERLCAFLGDAGFSALPAAVDPSSRGVTSKGAYGVPERRSARKRAQIRAMVAAAAALAPAVCRRGRDTPRSFVDFCGGCGHVGLVLAALYPSWTVTVVDMKDGALAVVRNRAKEASLSNVRVWKGLVRDYEPPFDIGLALHACGAASDDVLAICVRRGALAVVAPCCVGAVVSERASHSGEADFGNARSGVLQSALVDGEFSILARAADYGEARSGADAWRCASKAIVENDRMQWLGERNYDAFLVKMRPLDCSPKNDIIIAFPRGQVTSKFTEDGDANRYLHTIIQGGAKDAYPDEQVQRIERRIRNTVLAEGSPGVLEFACSRGARERRLVHAIADGLSLQHESLGRGASRRVRVWRSTQWPVFYNYYVGVAGSAVQKAGERVAQLVPEDAIQVREDVRGVALHITVFKPQEVRSLLQQGRIQGPDELLNVAYDSLNGSSFEVLGLGSCSVDEKAAFYAVVRWNEAQRCRAALGFPAADLHITVGFRGSDIHSMTKDESTIVTEDLFVCRPWGD